jgi:hypothetical protein
MALTRSEQRRVEKIRQRQEARRLNLEVRGGRDPRGFLLDDDTVSRIRGRRFGLSRPARV